jgi:hypothetical protein
VRGKPRQRRATELVGSDAVGLMRWARGVVARRRDADAAALVKLMGASRSGFVQRFAGIVGETLPHAPVPACACIGHGRGSMDVPEADGVTGCGSDAGDAGPQPILELTMTVSRR